MDWLVSLGLIALVVLIVYLSWRNPKKRIRALQRKEKTLRFSEDMAQTIREYNALGEHQNPDPPIVPKKHLPEATETEVRTQLNELLTSKITGYGDFSGDADFIDSVIARYKRPMADYEAGCTVADLLILRGHTVYAITSRIRYAVDDLASMEYKTPDEYATLRARMARLKGRRLALGVQMKAMVDSAEKHLEDYLRK